MSRARLPLEISDYIVDLLPVRKRKTLKACCLVSKSWVPRARRKLFRGVTFRSLDDLKAWKDTFPDPFNSPARYTRTLSISCTQVISAAAVKESDWIQAFCNVKHLSVGADEICSTSQLFNLVCSLPILEDLTLVNHESGEIADDNTIFQPSTVPPLSGALNLCLTRGMEPVACQLRELPDGVRFRKLNLALSLDDDLRCTATIVEACSGTLESIKIQCPNYMDPTAGSIDFSKAIKLKEVLFQFQNFRHAWVALALETLTTKHTDFRKVTILMPLIRSSFILSSIRPILGEKSYNQWMDLDRVLIRLWESNAIHVQVTYCAEIGGGWSSEYIESLFPEMKKRGLLEMGYDRDLF